MIPDVFHFNLVNSDSIHRSLSRACFLVFSDLVGSAQCVIYRATS